MTNNLPLRLRYNYVLSEVDFVLFDDLANYAIVTEDFLCRKYQERFNKNLKSELQVLDVELRWLIEQEFGTRLKWMADSEFNAIVRRSSINTQHPVDPPAKDTNANVLPLMTLQVVEAHHALADGNNGYAAPAWKDHRKLQELLSYFRESEAFVADDQLIKARATMAAKFYRDRHPMSVNLVDYYALIKHGGSLGLDHYERFREWTDFDDFSGQKFGHELKDLRLRTANVGEQPSDAIYGFHHADIRLNLMKHTEFPCETKPVFPRLPLIAVFERRQRQARATKPPPLTYVRMERLEVFEDKELIFACIRLARLTKLPPLKQQAVKTECLIEI